MNHRLSFCIGIALTLAFSPIVYSAERDAVEPYEPAGQTTNAWHGLEPVSLRGTFVSTDLRIARDSLFDAGAQATQVCTVSAWRGERVNAQVVVSSVSGCAQLRAILKNEGLPGGRTRIEFVRYTLGERGELFGDILDRAERLEMTPNSSRPLWVTVDVPHNATSGVYHIPFSITAQGVTNLEFTLNVNVLPAVLPASKNWSFHLDLWQNPYAVARYHHVAPWSPEHLALLAPHMKMLAEAGQKALTASIVHQPWGTQTYDPYDSMIEWIRCADGSWSYDYTIFDRWVELGSRCGIDHQISCYSLIPWSNRFRYLDETSGDYRVVEAQPGTPAYEEHLRPFLHDFERHLKSKGWLDKTYVAMDERPMPIMRKLLAFLQREAPGLKVASAANYSPEVSDAIFDLSVAIEHSESLAPSVLQQRSAGGRDTTFYVCCGPSAPNTFVSSPPAEAEWLPLYAAAHGFDGFLRWAYDSWVADPFRDTAHVTWTAGDCFLVYPGARSSVRFERLRCGIQDFEKIRLLRAAQGQTNASAEFKAAMDKLNKALEEVRFAKASNGKVESDVRAVRAAIDEASRLQPATD